MSPQQAPESTSRSVKLNWKKYRLHIIKELYGCACSNIIPCALHSWGDNGLRGPEPPFAEGWLMGRVGGALLVIVSQPLPQSDGGGGFLCEGCAVISEAPDNEPGPGHFCSPPCCQAQQNPEVRFGISYYQEMYIY